MNPGTPTISSSLSSLKVALYDAQSEIPSPTFSNETGQTGSSEEPGSATRSLVLSVDGRHPPSTSLLQRLEQDSHSLPDTGNLELASKVHVTDGEGDLVGGSGFLDHFQSPSPVDNLRLPLSAVRSDDSWASVSVPLEEAALAPVKTEDEEDHVYGESEHVERLEMSMVKSHSDLQRWLRTTMTDALGDGTSTVDSEEAFEAVAHSTSQARLGRNSTTSQPPPSQGLRSPFQSRTPSLVQSLDSLSGAYHSDLVKSESISEESFGLSLLESDTMPIKLEEEDSAILVDIKAEVKDVVVEAGPSLSTKVAKTETSPPAQVVARYPSSKGDLPWKILSLVLTLCLVANLAQTHLQWVLPSLLEATGVLPPAPLPSPSIPVFNAINYTSEIVDDVVFHPVGYLLPRWALPTSATVIVLALTIAILLNRRSSSPSTRPRSRSRSPLLEQNPVDSVDGPELITQGIRLYTSGQLGESARLFNEVVESGCFLHDKAAASEWLGRTQYRLARLQASPSLMREAVTAFERAIRLNSTKATARASLGRALLVLQDVEGANRALKAAVRRDATLAFAHEYLGKSYAALDQWMVAEIHLREAIRLDPLSYTAHAFLGERIHQAGRNREAKVELEHAVRLRSDYTAAHARLAFLATEALDKATACFHYRMVIATRETGLVDDNFLPLTLEIIQGALPFLALYFELPHTEKAQRTSVLRDALALYPREQLLLILLAIQLRTSKSREERNTALAELRQMEGNLKKCNERFKGDIYAHGLCALVQMGLGKAKQTEVEYSMFWRRVSSDPNAASKVGEGKFAFVLMALYEMRKK